MATEFKTNGYEYKPSTVDGVNGAASPPVKKGGKLKAHFRRFWWLHAINVVLGTVLITCLLLFVGLPNIAQAGIDDSTLETISQVVSNPTPSQITLNLINKATSKSPFTPTLDSFNAVLFLENTEPNIKPFGNITIPSIHVQKEVQISLTQDLVIQDMQQFIAYNTLVAKTETYRVALRGATMLHLGALPVVKVNFNKALTLKGLNGLKGITAKNLNISLTALPPKPNLRGDIVIPNPTVMTLTLGTIVQEISIDGTPIGNSTIENVVLKPGMNTFPMTSMSNPAVVISMITNKYKDAHVPVLAKTLSVTYNGQRLPYFEAALAATPVLLNLDLGPALAAIGLNLGALTAPGGAAAGAGAGAPAPGAPAPGGESAPPATLPSSAPPMPAAPAESSAAAAPSMSMSMPMV